MKFTYLAACISLGFVACGTNDHSPATSRLNADTSGCSPLLNRADEVTTAQGHRLSATNERPNNPRCWNTNYSYLRITYTWKQPADAPFPKKIGFWIRGSGSDRLVEAGFNCGPLATDANTLVCNAQRTLNEYFDTIEIAPVRDGNWDTRGIGQNYILSL